MCVRLRQRIQQLVADCAFWSGAIGIGGIADEDAAEFFVEASGAVA